MNTFSEEQIFIIFCIHGIIIGMFLDLFRVLRKCFKTPDTLTFIEDIIFLIISGTTIVLGVVKFNNGEIRLFLFLGICLGLLLYFLTISNLYVIILSVLINLCKKMLKIPYNFVKKLQKYVVTVTKKVFKTFCRILLKKR